MPTISKDDKLLTLINVFTVGPTNQQELVALLVEATQRSVRHVTGFVSASLHRSLDGTKVAMYAQWRSLEDYQAMRPTRPPRRTWIGRWRWLPSSLGCTRWLRPLHRRPPNKRLKLAGLSLLRESECCGLAGTNYRSTAPRPAGESPAA